jgi:hypothetical protein
LVPDSPPGAESFGTGRHFATSLLPGSGIKMAVPNLFAPGGEFREPKCSGTDRDNIGDNESGKILHYHTMIQNMMNFNRVPPMPDAFGSFIIAKLAQLA